MSVGWRVEEEEEGRVKGVRGDARAKRRKGERAREGALDTGFFPRVTCTFKPCLKHTHGRAALLRYRLWMVVIGLRYPLPALAMCRCTPTYMNECATSLQSTKKALLRERSALDWGSPG